jgi:hypothetical protein
VEKLRRHDIPMATKMHRKYLYKVGAVAGPARKSVRAERFVTLTHEFRAQKVVVDGSPVAGPALGKRVFFFCFFTILILINI